MGPDGKAIGTRSKSLPTSFQSGELRIQSDWQSRRMRTSAAIEQERIRQQFALEILRSLPIGDRGLHAGPRIAQVLEYAVVPATKALEGLASDSKVLNAKLVGDSDDEAPRAAAALDVT